ncbi:ComEC/Rec2 family competence protein [Mycolicibacterium parafortuitum]|uniref:ComEC/Rec2 family competence protein n=1 Tax=Mycolicibacterium parafortuitum TaxID=39692 RepID=UPI0032C4AC1C
MDLRLVPAALAGWAVTAAGILWLRAGAVTALAVAVTVTAALGGWAGRRTPGGPHRMPVAAVLAVALIGAGFAVAVVVRVAAVDGHPVAGYVGTVTTVTVTPTETPRVLEGGRTMFRGSLAALDGARSWGDVLVFAPGGDYARLAAGQPAAFRARIGRPTRRDLTVAVLTATGDPTVGEAAAVHRAAHHLRTRFADAARLALPPDQAAMLPALVLGDTSAVPATATAEFRRSGLTHLTAVSGANVTIVCGAVLLSAVVIGPRAAVALAAVALVAFVVVVQPSASVLRAALMGAITLLAVVSHRRRQALPALAATVVAVMVAAPRLAVDVGFALSVSATAALIVIAPGWSRRLVDRGWPRPLADAVSVAVAAQLVTAPLVAGISGSMSLVAVAANLAVAPVIPPITVLGTAAAALCAVWPAGAEVLIRFTGPEVWWLLGVARWAARMPAAAVPMPSGATGVLIAAMLMLAAAAGWHWVVSGRRDTIVR